MGAFCAVRIIWCGSSYYYPTSGGFLSIVQFYWFGSYGVRTAWHGPVDMTPIGHAVNLHMDISSPNFGVQEWADSFTGLYAQLNGQLMTEMFPGMPQRRDGYLYLSDRPGIGVDFDEKLAAKYPCKPGAVSWDWMLARLPDGTSVRP